MAAGELQVEPAIWKACAGSRVDIPAVNSRVYYFPQGHMDHSSDPQSVLPLISHLPPTPFLICRVLQVLYLVDPDSDEVFTRIRLTPLDNARILENPTEVNTDAVVSFAKVLTLSDANNGGGFSVPRLCAESIFPPLDFTADPPVQTLHMRDLKGNSWHFRHIHRGTPRRHLLTTGWSKYVNNKKLISGDSVVFMKNNLTGMLYVGVRRAKKSVSSADLARWVAMYSAMAKASPIGMMMPKKKDDKAPPEAVAEAMKLAANRKAFEVVYYPKTGLQNFVVAASKVEAAMAVSWSPGFRVKIVLEAEDSSRMICVEGTVSSVLASPWNMLQVTWDEVGVVKNMEKVNPWQVECVEPSQLPMPEAPFKKRKFAQIGGLSDSISEPSGNGVQGARQNTDQLELDLNLGGSSLSPESSISFKSASPEVNATSVKLFGQTVYIAAASSTRDSYGEMQEAGSLPPK